VDEHPLKNGTFATSDLDVLVERLAKVLRQAAEQADSQVVRTWFNALLEGGESAAETVERCAPPSKPLRPRCERPQGVTPGRRAKSPVTAERKNGDRGAVASNEAGGAGVMPDPAL
jgi:hypothetical protein